jgi:hypothetical protein
MKVDEDKGQPASGWTYRRDDATDPGEAAEPARPEYSTINTTAPSERPRQQEIAWKAGDSTRPRPAGWLAMIVGGAMVLGALAYLLTRDAFTAVIIPLAALVFGLYSVRKPQALQYRLDGGGIVVNGRRYAYSQFRSFGIEQDGPVHNIILMPLKRFMPEVSVDYTPDLEDRIVAVLADHLPVEVPKHDAMDMLIRKLRF